MHVFRWLFSAGKEATSQSSNHLKHDSLFSVLKCPPQSPDLNPLEQFSDVLKQNINIIHVQQKTPKECQNTAKDLYILFITFEIC